MEYLLSTWHLRREWKWDGGIGVK